MNIEYLKYFAELAKIQHYGKAAKVLNISQPGLSHAIKTLEDEYGVPLFQKEGRNVSLSPYGQELIQDIDEILDAYRRMEERPQDCGMKRRPFGSARCFLWRRRRFPTCCENLEQPFRLSSITG